MQGEKGEPGAIITADGSLTELLGRKGQKVSSYCFLFFQNIWWPCYQPPLLDTVEVLIVIAVYVHPQQGEAGVVGPVGPRVRHFQNSVNSFLILFWH